MALSIKHEEADKMARELAERKGISLTDAVVTALREELARERARTRRSVVVDELMDIGRRYSEAPLLDERSDDEILGYDDHGLPS